MKEITIREVKGGFIVTCHDAAEGEMETVFTKMYQVQRFVKEYLNEKNAE
jgi:hypothetical protein